MSRWRQVAQTYQVNFQIIAIISQIAEAVKCERNFPEVGFLHCLQPRSKKKTRNSTFTFYCPTSNAKVRNFSFGSCTGRVKKCNKSVMHFKLIKQPTFRDATAGLPAKWSLRNEHRNSILMTSHYPDLGCASDWLNQISHATRRARSHQIGIHQSSQTTL